VSFVFVSSVNRGGMLSVIVALVLVTLLARKISWGRAGMVLAGGVVAVLLVFGAAGAKVHISAARTLSLDQLVTNVSSVFFPQDSSNTATSNTAHWRLDWWKKIIGYTFGGSYFWTGKGYGVNLADSDGFQIGAGHVLRAPHNSSMSILARSGVPGFALWVALLVTFAFQMVRMVLHARRRDRVVWSRVALWCFVYWLAMVVDSCFDVALEGPQLGIWFWSLMGFGVALQTVYKEHFAYADHGTITNFVPEGEWTELPVLAHIQSNSTASS
jgi:O-antigen ligase